MAVLTVLPSFRSTTNLCCSITKSRSPAWKLHSRCPGCLLLDLSPGHPIFQPWLVLRVEPSEVEQGPDKGRIPLVPERPSDDGAGFRDLVRLAKRNRISVGVCDKRVPVQDMVRACLAHEVLVRDVDHLSVFQERGRVLLREQGATRRP